MNSQFPHYRANDGFLPVRSLPTTDIPPRCFPKCPNNPSTRIHRIDNDGDGLQGFEPKRLCAQASNRYNKLKQKRLHRLGFAPTGGWSFRKRAKVLDTLSSCNKSQSFSPNHHQSIIPFKAGSNLIAIRVLAVSKGWMLAVGAPAPPLVFREDQNWKPTQLEGHTEIIPGTPLDLAAMVDVPAGKHGPVVTGKQGNLEFKGLPGIQQRFLGCNGIPGGLFHIRR